MHNLCKMQLYHISSGYVTITPGDSKENMVVKKIAILGCGNGGQALAGYLSLLGHQVNLYAHPDHPGGIKTIQQHQGIELGGIVNGFGKINLASTDLQECVADAEVILMTLPALACEEIFTKILPYLKNGQIIVNMAGYFSSIIEDQIRIKNRPELDITITELTTFPYACRAEGNNKVNIVANKKFVGISAITPSQTDNVIRELVNIIPCPLVAKSSALEVSLYNASGIYHSVTVIFNAARIGNQDEFYFYKEGISEETANAMIRLDQERRNIGQKLGYNLPENYQQLNAYYGYNYSSIYDYYKNSQAHNTIKFMPPSTRTRYILEDIQYLLVPWQSIGQSIGIETKGIKAMIDIASFLHDTDYMTSGRKLDTEMISYYK